MPYSLICVSTAPGSYGTPEDYAGKKKKKKKLRIYIIQQADRIRHATMVNIYAETEDATLTNLLCAS